MALTPMLEQYLDIKNKHKDAILFFRLGDFYEMFFEDAKLVSKELELTLTGKDCGLEERAPMCGIPYHSVNTYIPKLIEKGYKIAICEQVEDPKQAVGIVKREVIKIITPGTILDSNILEEKKHNYIASYCIEKENAVFCYADISTGEVSISSEFSGNTSQKIINEIARIIPSELVICEQEVDTSLINEVKKRFSIYISPYSSNEQIENSLIEQKELSCLQKKSLYCLLSYIQNSQKDSVSQINDITCYEFEKYMQLDIQTRRNLEIVESNREKTKKGSLLWVLDKTVTAMGSRMLRDWIQNPLLDITMITQRLNAVGTLLDNFVLKDELIECLKSVYDMERLISKIVTNSATPREYISLKNSISNLPKIKELITFLANASKDEYLGYIASNLDVLKDVYTIIDKAIVQDAPVTIKEGNVIKQGYNELVDSYRMAKNEGKNWLMELEAKERNLTDIKTLKISYNRVFGYYIEVTNSYKSMVPKDRYITKQTLAGCERYFTPELKEIEEKILNAESKINDLEYMLFCDIRDKVSQQVVRVQHSARLIAILDTLLSYATVSSEYGYVKPVMNQDCIINIVDGRHAVVEKALKDISFIPNDTLLNNAEDNLLIITGPNMAGKSTYMRQVAIITYMAQIGCYVPAKSANLCVVDRIFTRVGASDDLAMGESTFMVEMVELSNILKHATNKSLVILDEIGRGTSTYDGLSIAWSTVEFITSEIGCKTLFATHYHELTELENRVEGVKNYSIQTEENGDDVIFMHKILRGAADESYGIYVAKLAGVPKKVISRSKAILKDLKLTDIAKKSIENSKKIDAQEIAVDMFNYKLNELASYVEKIDVDELSPKESLQILYKMKEKMK